MRIVWIAVLLAVLSCGAALGQGTIELTVATVNTAGNPLNGSITLKTDDGASWSVSSTGTWTVAAGVQVQFTGNWGGLRYSSPWTTVPADTTLRFDALTGAVSAEQTPGTHRIEIVFEPITVTGDTVDESRNPLSWGRFYFKLYYPGHRYDAPHTWTMANGGTVNRQATWGGLGSRTVSGRIYKGTTYVVDALTSSSQELSTPGITRCEFVFEPISVTGETVEFTGAPLPGKFVIGVPSLAKPHDSPYTWRMANGARVTLGGGWGGLWLPSSGGHTILKDMTYRYDALTGVSSSEATLGINRIEILFEVITITIATIDGSGDPIPGRGKFQSHPFLPNISWHDTPFVSSMAHGGLMEFFAESSGIRSDTIRNRMYKNETHILDGLTDEYRVEDSSGVNRIEVVYSFNTPPVAQAGPDFAVEANTAEGSIITMDGSGSSDDGEIVPLTYLWTWVDGTDSGMTVDIFLPLGTTQVTLTVDDGEYAASDIVAITVQDTTPPEISCPGDLTLEAGTAGNETAYAAWKASVTANDICDADVQVTSNAPNWTDLPIEGIDGSGTLVTWMAVDDSGNASACSAVVRRLDTTPPDIAVEVTPSLIWPPNHKLITVQATVTAHDIVDSSPVIALVSITSNEPEDVHEGGDGSTELDIQEAALGTPDFEFLLRAERQGASEGRIYTITYSATDACGNSQLATAEVIVPHEFGKQQP